MIAIVMIFLSIYFFGGCPSSCAVKLGMRQAPQWNEDVGAGVLEYKALGIELMPTEDA
jgi:hypothetical protein